MAPAPRASRPMSETHNCTRPGGRHAPTSIMSGWPSRAPQAHEGIVVPLTTHKRRRHKGSHASRPDLASCIHHVHGALPSAPARRPARPARPQRDCPALHLRAGAAMRRRRRLQRARWQQRSYAWRSKSVCKMCHARGAQLRVLRPAHPADCGCCVLPGQAQRQAGRRAHACAAPLGRGLITASQSQSMPVARLYRVPSRPATRWYNARDGVWTSMGHLESM
jgi:hypothetical protein